eukprot:TRINITY_DN5846_c0_g1_i2.p1 TRINITY_DN5846_c0_g1~~TRINITY_DN5846_c0_g1_i2.p1  ORF type:complete len:430 (+),score=64.55 TRINITY_DN5846_c0_g1_i2:40-1329(+)
MMGSISSLVLFICVSVFAFCFFFFSSRRRHTRCREVSWARRCVQETGTWEHIILVVAGSRLYNQETKRREVLNDVQAFNTLDRKWSELQCDGVMLEHRRGHAACLVGKHLLVHGGMNNKDQYLSDTLMLAVGRPDMKEFNNRTYKWLRTSVKGGLPNRVAFHTCQFVLHPERYRAFENIGVYSLPEIKGLKTRMEYEGVYFFGGRNERGPSNKLFILQIGTKPAEWIEPDVEGAPPVARYGHSMNFYSDRNIIILFGGRNDDNFKSSGKSYLNDVWVLYLEKLCWVFWDKREGLAEPPEERYSHCSTIFQGAILIFGGLSEENYCKSTLHALELEPVKKTKKYQQKYSRKAFKITWGRKRFSARKYCKSFSSKWNFINVRKCYRTKIETISNKSYFINWGFGVLGFWGCLLYTSPSPRDLSTSRMPSSA